MAALSEYHSTPTKTRPDTKLDTESKAELDDPERERLQYSIDSAILDLLVVLIQY